MLAQVDDGDVGAFAREQHRDRAADAGVAAGDQRGHALELAAAAVVRRQEVRLGIELLFAAGFLQVLRRQRILRLLGLRRRLVGRCFLDAGLRSASWSMAAWIARWRSTVALAALAVRLVALMLPYSVAGNAGHFSEGGVRHR